MKKVIFWIFSGILLGVFMKMRNIIRMIVGGVINFIISCILCFNIIDKVNNMKSIWYATNGWKREATIIVKDDSKNFLLRKT